MDEIKTELHRWVDKFDLMTARLVLSFIKHLLS